MLLVLGGSSWFFLFVFSQNEVWFFEGDQYSIILVKIEDLVFIVGMEDVFVFFDLYDVLQYYSSGCDGGENVIYYG